jgi:hypothetical protein
VANVNNRVNDLRADYALVQHTRAEYRANGESFTAALAQPAKVVTKGDEQTVTNLARFDYDNLSNAIVDLSPSNTVSDSLYFFSFVLFPLIFFFLGLWMSSIARRYRFEKSLIVRNGTAVTVAARQAALIAAALVVLGVVLVVEGISRGIASSTLAQQLPLHSYPPLGPAAHPDIGGQWLLAALIIVFFGGAGILVGSVIGVFGVPAILFLVWDMLVPFLGPGDPRNWFVVLGHAVYRTSGGGGVELALALPLAQPLALTFSIGGAGLVVVLGYVGIGIRNPIAT